MRLEVRLIFRCDILGRLVNSCHCAALLRLMYILAFLARAMSISKLY